jgi:hypothetical protein
MKQNEYWYGLDVTPFIRPGTMREMVMQELLELPYGA